jgi:hypothetical protein
MIGYVERMRDRKKQTSRPTKSAEGRVLIQDGGQKGNGYVRAFVC